MLFPTVISTPQGVAGTLPLTHAQCTVIKLHGDYLDIRIKNTPQELEQYDQQLDAILDRILDEFGLIVSGWSAEWDTALRAAFERCQPLHNILDSERRSGRNSQETHYAQARRNHQDTRCRCLL